MKKYLPFALFFLILAPVVYAASIALQGKAVSVNTGGFIDFDNYNSNVSVDSNTGNFTGYVFSEDVGWILFDNVNVDVGTGVVTGTATAVETGANIDFSQYNSNVKINLSTNEFTGFAFSEDIGWINFASTGVSLTSSLNTDPPEAFYIDAPGGNSYTNNPRPVFRWNARQNDDNPVTLYVVQVDNGDTGDFALTNIPTDRTERFETPKYVAEYFGFEDNDHSNNFINLSVRSSAEWHNDPNSGNNDGMLKEGIRNWKVFAFSRNGTATMTSSDLYVDFNPPTLELTSIDNTAHGTKPMFWGKVTDKRVAGVASGPGEVEIKVEKKNGRGYELHTLATVKMGTLWWEDTHQKVNDNRDNRADKYALFEFSPDDPLPAGNYRVTFNPRDVAGNWGPAEVYTFTTSGAQTGDSVASPLPTPTAKPTATPQSTSVPTASEAPEPTPVATPIPAPTTEVQDEGGFLSGLISFFQRLGRFAGNVTSGLASTRFTDWLSYTAVSFREIVLDDSPTRITDVHIAEVGPDYAIIRWNTNHHTKNNKVNYGETLSYGKDAFGDDWETEHEVRLENLEPGTTYVFEVMSQNKNYIYDAHHTFTTKK